MKKYLLIAGVILAPWSVNAARSVTGYVAARCDGSYANKGIEFLCENPLLSCGSSGADVITSGTYEDYDDCVNVQKADGTYNYIVCFWSEDYTVALDACYALKNGSCHSNYLGGAVAGTAFSGAALGKTITVYPDQITCCQECSGKSYSSPRTGVVYEQRNICSEDGVCAGSTKSAHIKLYCDNRYFSGTGTKVLSGVQPSTSSYNELMCTPCSQGISGIVVSDTYSPEQSASQTECYIPKDHEIDDSTGTYKYTSDCPYTA